MTRKQKRAAVIGGGVLTLAVAAIMVMFALRDSIVFFHSPSDIVEKKTASGERIRLGGLVQKGSVVRGQGASVAFAVTDTINTILVRYKGVLPDLFREGQGVVTEGALDSSGVFQADSVLAKHDETYMPPEVAKSLEERGVKLGASAHPDSIATPATTNTAP